VKRALSIATDVLIAFLLLEGLFLIVEWLT
jgi:hypothetical protein